MPCVSGSVFIHSYNVCKRVVLAPLQMAESASQSCHHIHSPHTSLCRGSRITKPTYRIQRETWPPNNSWIQEQKLNTETPRKRTRRRNRSWEGNKRNRCKGTRAQQRQKRTLGGFLYQIDGARNPRPWYHCCTRR